MVIHIILQTFSVWPHFSHTGIGITYQLKACLKRSRVHFYDYLLKIFIEWMSAHSGPCPKDSSVLFMRYR